MKTLQQLWDEQHALLCPSHPNHSILTSQHSSWVAIRMRTYHSTHMNDSGSDLPPSSFDLMQNKSLHSLVLRTPFPTSQQHTSHVHETSSQHSRIHPKTRSPREHSSIKGTKQNISATPKHHLVGNAPTTTTTTTTGLNGVRHVHPINVAAAYNSSSSPMSTATSSRTSLLRNTISASGGEDAMRPFREDMPTALGSRDTSTSLSGSRSHSSFAQAPNLDSVPLVPPSVADHGLVDYAQPPPAMGPQVVHVETVPCPKCERHFQVDRLDKHRQICEKVKDARERGVYNTTQKRLADLERVASVAAVHRTSPPKIPTNHWREQHERLMRTLRGTRRRKEGEADDAYLDDLPDDRVPCPHCGRKFNEEVAKKHVERCNYAKTKWKT